MRISVGLGSTLALSPDELTGLARPATQLGFDTIWTHQRTVPDSFHVCEQWWAESARRRPGGTRVAVGVLPAPQHWRPQGLAAQAATAALLTEGNFALGIGTGGYGPGFWSALGLPNRPIAVMRDYIAALRAAFCGTDYAGSTVSLQNFALERRPPPVPIWLAALGPQMMRLGGQCADGVLLNWASPEVIAESKQWLGEGVVAANRDRAEVTMSMYLRCVVDDDIDAARRVIAAEVLRKLAPRARSERDPGSTLGYRGQFVRLGFEPDVVRLERRFDAGATSTDLLDEVPAELCAAAGYFGPAADAPKRVAELADGLDEVVVWVVTSRPGIDAVLATMEALAPDKIRAASVEHAG